MVTGRLGYAVDRVLFYAKGGVAFLDESVSVSHQAFPNLGIPAVAVSASNNNAHWTIGGGIEWAFANNWTLKAEYMAIGLKTITLRLCNRRACHPGWKLLLEPQRAGRCEHIQGRSELSIRRWCAPLCAILSPALTFCGRSGSSENVHGLSRGTPGANLRSFPFRPTRFSPTAPFSIFV